MPPTPTPPAVPTVPVLRTERLVLTAVRPDGDDTDTVYAACQDPEIQRWTVIPSPYTRADAVHFTDTLAAEGRRTGKDLVFAFRATEDGPLLGCVAVHRREHPLTAEVGFWATPAARGRGLTVEALTALARWAFAELGLARLEWRAYLGNDASRAVAERVGFRVEGVQRAALVQRGELRDCLVGGLLAEDLGLPMPAPHAPAPARP
ncbi:GNAT family N-acetyltransferase [Streptomyces sp. BI20]|uniref:GNAT family N-acetyltransferase n=1 Tax=Streptomyces sp. BI20 TaxID=3403460 RepID=UPI003C75BCC2